MQKTYRTIIVEDDEEIRARLARLLESHKSFDVIATCVNCTEGLQALQENQPDILLTDIGLPDGSGIEIIQQIEKSQITCEAMVISGFHDEETVFAALKAGASAYILKHDDSTRIIDSILSMMAGGAPMSPRIARMMLQQFKTTTTEAPPSDETQCEALTERQIKILKLISQGFSSREIAEKLSISYYTVTTHIKNIYRKLQVNSRTEALHEALKMRLIS